MIGLQPAYRKGRYFIASAEGLSFRNAE